MNRNHLLRWVLATVLAAACCGMALGGEADTAVVTGQPAQTATINDQEEEAIPSLTESVMPSLTRIAITLCVVVFIIYLTVFLLKKLSGSRMGGVGKGKTVQVIEQTYLAPKKSVCLLKLADRAVLVGITDSSINLLTEFDWEALPSDVLDRVSRAPGGFHGILNEAASRLLGGKKAKGAGRERTL